VEVELPGDGRGDLARLDRLQNVFAAAFLRVRDDVERPTLAGLGKRALKRAAQIIALEAAMSRGFGSSLITSSPGSIPRQQRSSAPTARCSTK
jgi:hypothetical protein